MARSKYDKYFQEDEKATELTFNKGTYIVVRIDGDKFHHFCTEHNFHKPNDKRALDLMVESAKHLMRTYKGHIPLAYGHSDEFSFLIRSSSNILSRRVLRITSLLPVIFAVYYNRSWDRFLSNPVQGVPTARKYDAWFDARPKEYANQNLVMKYFKWRQIDCHINNLYNTTLHTLTGRYVKHELIPLDPGEKLEDRDVFSNGSGDGQLFKVNRTPITEWISDITKFLSARDATQKLSKTISEEKQKIMADDYGIIYNDELEQFKKGTVIVDTQKDFDGDNADPESIKHFNIDLITNTTFWKQNSHIFDSTETD